MCNIVRRRFESVVGVFDEGAFFETFRVVHIEFDQFALKLDPRGVKHVLNGLLGRRVVFLGQCRCKFFKECVKLPFRQVQLHIQLTILV